MKDTRPSPDELLAQVNADEHRRKRGKLKLFFGAIAGVGKTYAMLEAARAQKTAGADVVVGIVETHGRRETEALLDGLDILPPRYVEYRGTKLREFDLEAALARKPEVLLVDELAHTNPPGSANPKRWQDVQALLDAGINVCTTLNVQHIESLQDIVAQITGIAVQETIPDSVVESADEIALIDLPPDDLLQRLREGKVYIPEQAELAERNFFRKGNLIALRELALRSTADRVDLQARTYKQESVITQTWRTAERLLVCVSPSPLSAQLVRATRRLAAGLHAEWIAVTVEPPEISAEDRERLHENLGLARQLGAEIVKLAGADMVEEIVEYARRRSVTKIIAGKPGLLRWRDRLFGTLVDRLIRASGDIDVYVIKGEAGSVERTHAAPSKPAVHWQRYGWAAATVVICTLIAAAMSPYFNPANLTMPYLMGVVIVAARFGRGPGIVTSVLSVAAFDFFFVPPRFTFAVGDPQFLLTFAVMLIVSIIISSLTARLQWHTSEATQREEQQAALYRMSEQLSSARGTEKLLEILTHRVAEGLESDVVAMMPDEEGRLRVRAGDESMLPMNARERGVAQWVLDVGRAAGLGTDTVPSAEALYVPLNGTRGPIGVIGIRPIRATRQLTPDFLHLVEAFTSQAGLAIESDRYADEAWRAQMEAEAQKSRNLLLSSVSHDLRTPLSSITGAASALREQYDRLDPAARRELIETIGEETERLSRMVANMLEITQLEAGPIRLKKEICPIEDVLGTALKQLEKQLKRRPVSARFPADLPPVPLDSVLMERVFVNLLENAAKYTPPESPIEVTAAGTNRAVTVEVADRGSGISSGDEERVFEKFYRGKRAASAPGVGLGLTICRAIVEAHGGRIWVENRSDGGAAFKFTLPIEG